MIEIIIVIAVLIILLVIAMLCRSLVHVILHHYNQFDDKFKADDIWFDPRVSWQNKHFVRWTITLFDITITKFKIPVQFSDAFHFFNTVELGCYDLMVTILICLWLGLTWWTGIIIFLIVGVLLMPLFFNLGYEKIWR